MEYTPNNQPSPIITNSTQKSDPEHANFITTMADLAAMRVTRKNKEDLLRDSQTIIKDIESMQKWLVDNDLMLKGEDISLPTLAAALFQLCSGKFTLPKDIISCMRAIALCMEEIDAKDSIGELVGRVRTAMKDTEDRLKKQTGSANDVERIIEKAVQSASKPTYTQALGADHTSRAATRDHQIKNDMRIWGHLQRKQIILDGDEATKEQTAKLTPKELVLKANLALDKLEKDMVDDLREDQNERLEGTKFVAARILKNDGILFEMDSEEGANWLKQDEIMKGFENCLPGSVKVKGNNYQVVVQFIPITLKNRLEELYAVIENENSLPKGTIVSAKWLRNPANWNMNQTKVHMVFTIKFKQEANGIINHGHSAATCRSQEVCANCARDHPTRKCRVTRAEYQCATCKKHKRQDDHATWARQCPAFIKEKAQLRERKPENHFRYYPAENEPWTWTDGWAMTQEQIPSRPSQQQPHKEKDLRQRSILQWATRSKERANKDRTPPENSQNNNETLRIWQQNTRKSLSAQLLTIHAARNDYDIICIQEPHFDHLKATHATPVWRLITPTGWNRNELAEETP
ncbi:hypothetical protein M413DRAFT_7871 [Hebeloma cylindrosporum]|uniref:Endonuclease/exonuclease/phosphatase domain-containing protein n=1 Tax=Hebeloma cylindrosporum TaxID=76867 RepID=A0A0C2Y7D4_HEBCY|nr:hypothetical protein M413DRAFT_7871 [Hebeloma cylindrosporum h7]